MRYASEVIGLMAAYPGRDFRVGQILKGIERAWPRMEEQRRQAVRKAVNRVLAQLQEGGQVVVTPATGRGGYALYQWREEK